MESVINAVTGFWSGVDQYILAVLAILGGFSVLAKLTPSEADDKFIQKIINIINTLGLTKKK
jgi:hypothetical protein